MDKKLDWNSAYSNDETTRAVLDSEIFRNYAMREMAKEKFVLPLHVPSGTLIDRRYVDSALEEALSYPENSRERAAFIWSTNFETLILPWLLPAKHLFKASCKTEAFVLACVNCSSKL